MPAPDRGSAIQVEHPFGAINSLCAPDASVSMYIGSLMTAPAVCLFYKSMCLLLLQGKDNCTKWNYTPASNRWSCKTSRGPVWCCLTRFKPCGLSCICICSLLTTPVLLLSLQFTCLLPACRAKTTAPSGTTRQHQTGGSARHAGRLSSTTTTSG